MFWRRQALNPHGGPVLRCSFCNKPQNEVRKLIAGPTVFICDECIEVCNDIIAEERKVSEPQDLEEDDSAEVSPVATDGTTVVQCSLCGTRTLLADTVAVDNRGLLCLGCIGAIEAAVAERRASG